MKAKFLLALVLIALAGVYHFFALDERFSFSALQSIARENIWQAAFLYLVLYQFAAALNLPGTGPLTIVAGVLFGFAYGLLIAMLSTTLGAVLSMLIARTLLRDWIEHRFYLFLQGVNRGLERDGYFYLFTLRLIPGIPYFIVNPVFGLTQIRLVPYTFVSVLGLLPPTVVYVNAGAALGKIENLSIQNLMTPSLILSFVILLVFPFAVRWLLKKRSTNSAQPD